MPASLSPLSQENDDLESESLIYPKTIEVMRKFGGRDQKKPKAATKLSEDPEDILPQEDGEDLKLSVFHTFSCLFPEEAGKGEECNKRLRLHFNKVGYHIYGKEQSRRVPAVRAKPGNPGYGFRRAKWRNTLTDPADCAHCELVLRTAGFDTPTMERIKTRVQQIAIEWDSVRRPSRPAGPGRPRRDHDECKGDALSAAGRRQASDEDGGRDRQRKRLKVAHNKPAPGLEASSASVSDCSDGRVVLSSGNASNPCKMEERPRNTSHENAVCSNTAASRRPTPPSVRIIQPSEESSTASDTVCRLAGNAAYELVNADSIHRMTTDAMVSSAMKGLADGPDPQCSPAAAHVREGVSVHTLTPLRRPVEQSLHASSAISANLGSSNGHIGLPPAIKQERGLSGWEPVLGWRWRGAGGLHGDADGGSSEFGFDGAGGRTKRVKGSCGLADGLAVVERSGPLSRLHILAAAAALLPHEPIARFA